MNDNDPNYIGMENAWAALRMIREAVESFGPVASLESEEAGSATRPRAGARGRSDRGSAVAGEGGATQSHRGIAQC